MNRLIGAVDADVEAKTKKVVVAERTIKAINRNATVEPVDTALDSDRAKNAIAAADVVFGCLDKDLTRLALTELCARHSKPLFDLASDTGGTGEELWYGGRVFFANGKGCLVCQSVLDQEAIARDRMTTEQRDMHDRIYGVRRDELAGTGPMVVSVNGTVASLAVTEFMAFVTEIRSPAGHLVYRGDKQVIRRVVDPHEPDCYFCTEMRRAGHATRPATRSGS
jgi:hypothetical protein